MKTDTFLYRGGSLLLALAVAIIIAKSWWTAGDSRRALSWRPLVRLGVISYGVYLYSGLLINIIDGSSTHLSGVALFAVRLRRRSCPPRSVPPRRAADS